MFTQYRTKGFILKKENRGEADRLFTIYTEDFGKLDLLAKAERKITSKLRAGLELFYLSEIEFIQGKIYKTLTDVVLLDNFKNIKKELGTLQTACRIVDITDKLIRGEEPDKELWKLLKESLEALNRRGKEIIYYYFLWNFFSLLGYQLELYNCVLCRKKIAPSKIFFSVKEGGLFCEQCRKKTQKAEVIDPDMVKIIRIVLKKDLQTLKRLKVQEETLKNIKKISNKYIFWVLEKTQ